MSLKIFLLVLLSMRMGTRRRSILGVHPAKQVLVSKNLFRSSGGGFMSNMTVPSTQVNMGTACKGCGTGISVNCTCKGIDLGSVFMRERFSSRTLLHMKGFMRRFKLRDSADSSVGMAVRRPTDGRTFFGDQLVKTVFICSGGSFFNATDIRIRDRTLGGGSGRLNGVNCNTVDHLICHPLRSAKELFRLNVSNTCRAPECGDRPALGRADFSLKTGFPAHVTGIETIGTLVPSTGGLVGFAPRVVTKCNPITLRTRCCCLRIGQRGSFGGCGTDNVCKVLENLLVNNGCECSRASYNVTAPSSNSLRYMFKCGCASVSSAQSRVCNKHLGSISFAIGCCVGGCVV